MPIWLTTALILFKMNGPKFSGLMDLHLPPSGMPGNKIELLGVTLFLLFLLCRQFLLKIGPSKISLITSSKSLMTQFSIYQKHAIMLKFVYGLFDLIFFKISYWKITLNLKSYNLNIFIFLNFNITIKFFIWRNFFN
jgi:hypothetical protein